MVNYIDRLGRRLLALERGQLDFATAPQLPSSSFNDAALVQTRLVDSGMVDALGEPIMVEETAARFGLQPDGSNTTVSVVGPTPPQPVAPLVTAGPGTLVVEWTGEFVDRIEPYLDHDHVAVHVDTVADFTPTAATLKATMRATQGETATISVPAGAYFVSLVAVSQAGVWSTPAPYTSGAPGASGGADPVWVAEVEGRLDDVESVAAGAYTLADGKTRVFWETPVDASPGDMWVDADNDNRILHLQSDGVTWAPSAIGTQAIAASSITAELLASQIVLTSTLIAGNPLGAHVEVSGSGLVAYGVNSDDDIVPTSRLGTGDTDALAIFDPSTGETLASLDSEGKVSATKATLGLGGGDTIINGLPFEDHLDPLPRGQIVYAESPTQASSATVNTVYAYLEVQCILEPGRSYRVSTSPVYMSSGTAGARGLIFLYRRSGGGTVTTAAPSTQVDSARYYLPTTPLAYKGPGLSTSVRIPPSASPTEYRFLLAFMGEGANVNLVASAGYPVTLTVDDVGPYIEETGIYRFTDQGGSAGTTKANYVSIWKASHHSTYDGNGNLRSGVNDMVQGFYGSHQQAIAGFTGGAVTCSHSGELGKTIGQALTGATVTKVQAWLYANHWWNNSGGTALVGVSSAIPPFPTSGVGAYSPQVASANWPKPGGRWVTLPTTQNPRSIYVGRAPSSSLIYYGKFNGSTYPSSNPLLRIYYTR